MRMSAFMYGRWYNVRAPITAAALPASRLKKYTPGLPPSVTYVRTLSSGKAEVNGMGGTPRAWRWLT